MRSNNNVLITKYWSLGNMFLNENEDKFQTFNFNSNLCLKTL